MSAGNGGHGVHIVSPILDWNGYLDLQRAVVTLNGGSGVYADGSGAGAVTVHIANSMVTANQDSGLLQTGTTSWSAITAVKHPERSTFAIRGEWTSKAARRVGIFPAPGGSRFARGQSVCFCR